MPGSPGLGPQPVFPSLEAHIDLTDIKYEFEDSIAELRWQAEKRRQLLVARPPAEMKTRYERRGHGDGQTRGKRPDTDLQRKFWRVFSRQGPMERIPDFSLAFSV